MHCGLVSVSMGGIIECYWLNLGRQELLIANRGVFLTMVRVFNAKQMKIYD